MLHFCRYDLHLRPGRIRRRLTASRSLHGAGWLRSGWSPGRFAAMAITDDELQDIFTYHSPNDSQIPRYAAIRSAGLHLARAIVSCTHSCADQSAAIRKVREAVMTANAAIALEGEPPEGPNV